MELKEVGEQNIYLKPDFVITGCIEKLEKYVQYTPLFVISESRNIVFLNTTGKTKIPLSCNPS